MKFKEKSRLKKTEYSENKKRMRDGFTHHCKTLAKEGQVVFFGDSITELLNISDWYGEYSIKSGLELYNRGIGGDTTIGLYKRVEENVLSIKPKTVVLLIGTNDLGIGFDAEFISNSMENILKLFKSVCPECRVILQAVYPVIEGKAGKRRNKDILELNEKYKILAEKYGADFIDLTAVLSDENGNLRSEYTYDGLHLTAQGYAVTTKEIRKNLG
ncbi:MAG: GDSL-type esterase/lipase family protein [Acutalibacteraceae bacterium]|nr:GDSL-type esterase/lipase family protein [Acutalibacteraceae bacterium]